MEYHNFFLEHNWDIILSISVAIIFMMALTLWLLLQRVKYRFILLAWVFYLGLIVFGTIRLTQEEKLQRATWERYLCDMTQLFTDTTQKLGHEKIRPGEDYKEVHDQIMDLHTRWAKDLRIVGYIWTMRLLGDKKVEFICSCPCDINEDGKYNVEFEAGDPPFTPYMEDGDFAWFKVYADGFMGQTAIDADVFSSDYGRWVTAVAPLFDSKGNIEAVLGVDYNVKDWEKNTLSLRNKSLLLLNFLCVFALAGFYVIAFVHNTLNKTQLSNTQLQAAQIAAEDASLAKSEFLARMSHEIRTPMNAILGMTYLCLQTELNEKQKDYLEKTQSASTNLLGIIDDILDISKIEAGKMSLENTSFRLSHVVKDVVDVIEYKTKEKHLDLLVKIQESIPDHLLGDPLRLRQILLNLLGNASKFTEFGSVCLTVELDETEHSGVKLLFSIKDTGPGLTESQIAKLFTSFSQADGSTTRKYGGTGLGLAIAKTLVELMHGEIGVKSEPGKGTTFFFSALFESAEESLTSVSAIDLSFRRMLVADDDPVARELIQKMSRSFELRVDSAENGETAFVMLVRATLENDPYEFLVIDWKMPGLDGVETIKKIRQSEQIKVPPLILMISAYDRSECLAVTKNLNISVLLVKPFTKEFLCDALLAAFAGDQTVIKKSSDTASLVDTKILLVEDNKVNQMVASEMLKLAGADYTLAENGQEAVEFAKNQHFDLILMDVQMPIMDGLEATRLIREFNISVPILAMTANAMDTDYRKSLEAGMNDHLTKPIQLPKLQKAIAKWLKKAKKG